MRVLGVDPDMKGGLVLVDVAEMKIIDIARMPLTVKRPPLNEPVRVNPELLWKSLLGVRRLDAQYVILERALVRVQNGGQMTGGIDRTHQNFGAIWSLCELAFTPSRVIIANPSSWKKAMGLSSDKKQSNTMAAKLFPSHAKPFGMAKNTGLAEAALMAVWGNRKFKFTDG